MEETGRGTKPVKPRCTHMLEMVTLVIPLALGAMQRNPYLNHRQRSPNYGQKGAHVYKKLASVVQYLGHVKTYLVFEIEATISSNNKSKSAVSPWPVCWLGTVQVSGKVAVGGKSSGA